ncbi:cytochrome P450 704C1-like [Rhododendron vialii]|uniref:cytochrome P450 704C1-like n=1 Tax=Rhododendron vialii TaxID=182163 RepID=UPI00265DAA18|nr:cytochrome P450 704C1-like [Rhododendron vialii]
MASIELSTLVSIAAILVSSFILALLSIKLLSTSKLQGKIKKKYHPVGSTVFHQLFHFNKLHHFMTDRASKYKTYRLLSPFRNEIYTSDPANVEHMLKINFDNYGKVIIPLSHLCKDTFNSHLREGRSLYALVFQPDSQKLLFPYSAGSVLPSFSHRKLLFFHFYSLVLFYYLVYKDGRCAETDDILPDGFKLKKGDGVYYLAYAMGRMPYIWGDDAEDFRPERWLNNGIFQPESPFKFTAFHGGPRICLGKDFAYRQMKIVSMALLRFFRFKLADETKKVTYRTMFTLHIKGGLHLCAFPRAGFNNTEL